MDKGEKAKQLFKQGYNCAQAVVCAFADECGLDEDTAYRIASSFGGGVARMREVCGAVIGMSMVAGMLYGYRLGDEPAKRASITSGYRRSRENTGRRTAPSSAVSYCPAYLTQTAARQRSGRRNITRSGPAPTW